jgi:hypothetical protein
VADVDEVPPGPPPSLRRRLVGAGATWVVAVAVAVAAAHPEGCHPPDRGDARRAAVAAVAWLTENQAVDGAFLYRYDRDDARDLGGYSIVRHAGVLLSLAQARSNGVTAAEDAFGSGLSWIEAQLVTVDGGTAPALGSFIETGTVALLVAALVEWREATGATEHDDLLRSLGRFLQARVTDEGAVVAFVDARTGSEDTDSRSPFSTGETAWALAALHTTFPDEGWDRPALAVTHYIAGDRDDVERRFPPVSDHWVAYALAEIGVEWDRPLDDELRALARRQAGLFGLQTRYESQRREAGVVRWTRGPTALGAGVGTLGEGLGAILRLAAVDDEVAEWDAELVTRQRCVAGLLVDRQVAPPEAADHPEPASVTGAWFRQGVTQMDDQQHALSALLAALPVLAADDGSTP